MDTRRFLRQVINLLWIKYNHSKLTSAMLFQIVDVIEMPIPKEWRENYDNYRQEYKNYISGKLGQ